MKGKTNFSRRLKQVDGYNWLTPTPPPLFYDRSTPLDRSEKEKLKQQCGVSDSPERGTNDQKGQWQTWLTRWVTNPPTWKTERPVTVTPVH